jgi:hypothetical protein
VEASGLSPPSIAVLGREDLLIPPQFVNRTPWTHGIFVNIASEPIRSSDLLEQHCFWDATRGIYRDEKGGRLTRRSEPCGEWGLGSYRLIDDLISDALAIKRGPD